MIRAWRPCLHPHVPLVNPIKELLQIALPVRPAPSKDAAKDKRETSLGDAAAVSACVLRRRSASAASHRHETETRSPPSFTSRCTSLIAMPAFPRQSRQSSVPLSTAASKQPAAKLVSAVKSASANRHDPDVVSAANEEALAGSGSARRRSSHTPMASELLSTA